MYKEKFSLSCDPEVIAKIDKIAKKNKTSRSAISRMLLQMVEYVPPESLKETTPIPSLLGLEQSREVL